MLITAQCVLIIHLIRVDCIKLIIMTSDNSQDYEVL